MNAFLFFQMKCSYLGVLLGHLGEIFGTVDGMTPFYDFKQMIPELFPNDYDVNIAVREQFQANFNLNLLLKILFVLFN